MFRYSLVVLLGLGAVGPAAAASWADALFEELSRDFGSVPRGPTLNHPFRLTNKTDSPVHIASVRVSCGCVTATPLQNDLAPGQSTAIAIQMDTRRFSGVKSVTVYVQFDKPGWEEARLWVQANSRDDLTVQPEGLAFGLVKRGSSPTASVSVTFLGNSQWQIVEAHCDSNYIKTVIQETRRDTSEVAYQLSAQLRNDAPVGKWYTDVWLKTNSASTNKIRVPLTVEIESTLVISPTTVVLGDLKVGGEAERKVIVRGIKPFKITSIQGIDGQLTVRESNADSKPVHILTVTLKAASAGELNRTLRVITDLKDEGEIEFQAKAQIMP